MPGSGLCHGVDHEPLAGQHGGGLLECFVRIDSWNLHDSLTTSMPLSSHCADEKIKAQNGDVFTQGHSKQSRCRDRP